MSSPLDPSSIWRKIREFLGFGDSFGSSPTHRVSRRQRDEQNTRMLVSGLAIAAVIIVMTLGGGLLYDNVIKPNAVLAKVGNVEITREEYWKYQSVQLFNQASQYQQFASQVEGQQRTQFLTFAASFRAQADDVWGTTDVSDTTLAQMVEDQLYLDAADELGLDLSDDAVRGYVLQQFAPEGAQLVTPYPEPTLIPQRAIWATETATALGTMPVATPVAGTPSAATPEAAATPDPDIAAGQAENDFSVFKGDVFGAAHISEDEYYELVARPQLARELVTSAVGSEVPQTADQVHAYHILVGTEDLARELYERATSGADFEELARTNSTDDATAATGGDLGWFTSDQMVAPFAEAAFALAPGEISQPVQTQFGWHIIKVVDRDENRALTPLQYQHEQETAVQDVIADVRANTDIDADVDVAPTPTPTPSQFNPPADAPTPVASPAISATPIAPGTPGATPVIQGPVLATPEPGP